MSKEDEELRHIEELIRRKLYRPGLLRETLELSVGIKLDRIERMLKWLVVRRLENEHPFREDNVYHSGKYNDALPDISDILESGK